PPSEGPTHWSAGRSAENWSIPARQSRPRDGPAFSRRVSYPPGAPARRAGPTAMPLHSPPGPRPAPSPASLLVLLRGFRAIPAAFVAAQIPAPPAVFLEGHMAAAPRAGFPDGPVPGDEVAVRIAFAAVELAPLARRFFQQRRAALGAGRVDFNLD